MICEHCKAPGTEHRSACTNYKPMDAQDRRPVSWTLGAYGAFVVIMSVVMWGNWL